MTYEDIKRTGKGMMRHFHVDITVIVIYLDHNHQGGDANAGSYDCTSTPLDDSSYASDESEDPLRLIIE